MHAGELGDGREHAGVRGIAPAHLQNDHGGGVFVALAPGALYVDVVDRRAFALDRIGYVVQILDRRKFHIDRHVAKAPLKRALERVHDIQNDDQDHQNHDHAVVHAGAGSHAHADRGEETGGRSEAGHLLMARGEDRSCREETDAADDLGRIAGGIKFHAHDIDNGGPLTSHHLIFIAGKKH